MGVVLMVGLGEKINNPFDALGLPEHPEVPEKYSQSLVYAQVVEVERLQVLFQNVLKLIIQFIWIF
jgi:hypothetical protein